MDAAETNLTDGVVDDQNFLDAGKSATYSYDASNCFGFLHVELWDRVRLTPGYDENSFKADPMLLVRNGAVPTASFNERKVSGRGLTTIQYSSRTRNPANTTSPCSTTTCTSKKRPSTTSR